MNDDQNHEEHVQINEVLLALTERVEALEKYVSELPTPDKTYYKPKGHTKYMNVKENYDELYNRISTLEGN